MAARIERELETLADVQARVGDLPAHRIRLYPQPGTATEADLLDDSITGGKACELVHGIVVEKTVGFREERLAFWIGHLIQCFAERENLGVVAGSQGPIRLKLGLVRLPDVSFIRWDSIEEPDGPFLEFAPDLAVEVLSPSNTAKEMALSWRSARGRGFGSSGTSIRSGGR